MLEEPPDVVEKKRREAEKLVAETSALIDGKDKKPEDSYSYSYSYSYSDDGRTGGSPKDYSYSYSYSDDYSDEEPKKEKKTSSKPEAFNIVNKKKSPDAQKTQPLVRRQMPSHSPSYSYSYSYSYSDSYDDEAAKKKPLERKRDHSSVSPSTKQKERKKARYSSSDYSE
jgi:hypothetical protein